MDEQQKERYISQVSSVASLCEYPSVAKEQLEHVTKDIVQTMIEEDQRNVALKHQKKFEPVPLYPYEEAKAKFMPEAQKLAQEILCEAIRRKQPQRRLKATYLTSRIEPEKKLIVEGILAKKGSVSLSYLLRVLIDEFVEDTAFQNKVIIKAKAIVEKPTELTCPHCGTKASEGKFRAEVGSGSLASDPLDLINYIECGNCKNRFPFPEDYKAQERRKREEAKLQMAIQSVGGEAV